MVCEIYLFRFQGNFMPHEIFHGHRMFLHGHDFFFMGHELYQFKFYGKFMGLKKTMKMKISIFMTMKNGFMGISRFLMDFSSNCDW